ncbi:MAG: DUF3471 domain-containing protein [Gemmatimonadetes bacterium]|nr:DUF3471 domain-containing protein [Gemmatimonadota bacterium]
MGEPRRQHRRDGGHGWIPPRKQDRDGHPHQHEPVRRHPPVDGQRLRSAPGISPAKDYNAEYYAAEQADQARRRAAAKPPVKVEGTKPSLPLEAYAGTYTDSFMGTATVRLDGGKLFIKYDKSAIVGELEHFPLRLICRDDERCDHGEDAGDLQDRH